MGMRYPRPCLTLPPYPHLPPIPRCCSALSNLRWSASVSPMRDESLQSCTDIPTVWATPYYFPSLVAQPVHNASHPQIPYPQPVSTPFLLPSLPLPMYIRSPNQQRLFRGNLTPSMATSPYRAYAPNSSLTYSPAWCCRCPLLARR